MESIEVKVGIYEATLMLNIQKSMWEIGRIVNLNGMLESDVKEYRQFLFELIKKMNFLNSNQEWKMKKFEVWSKDELAKTVRANEIHFDRCLSCNKPQNECECTDEEIMSATQEVE